MISRRMILGGGLAGLAVPGWAEGLPFVRPKARPALPGKAAGGGAAAQGAQDLIAAAGLGGEVGYLVADARTGQVLEGVGADLALPPASTAKTITSLYALERLGPSHRFVTQIIATGPVQGGVVQGDLVLVGSGDPVLNTDDLGDLAASLRKAGVTAVAGRFLACDGALPDLPQIAGDQPDHVGYNPAISGLNLNYNRVNFEWKRASSGWGVQMDARGERFVPLVRMAKVSVVNREAPLFTYRGRGDAEEWTVASAALGKGGSRWLPVRQPGHYAGEVFQTLARAQGISLPEVKVVAVPPAGGVVLAQHASDPLPVILKGMLRYSTNLTAEVVGLRASGASRLEASAAAMGDWAQARLGANLRFVDHSGLGAASRISAAEMVKALGAAQSTPTGAGLTALLRDIGMRDDKGAAIKSPVKVLGKTGTLNFVSCLVGHIQPPGGREMIFAIFCADVKRRDKLPVAQRERPPGVQTWTAKARRLQGQLITRWAGLYA